MCDFLSDLLSDFPCVVGGGEGPQYGLETLGQHDGHKDHCGFLAKVVSRPRGGGPGPWV